MMGEWITDETRAVFLWITPGKRENNPEKGRVNPEKGRIGASKPL
jgi:hypothetical protein